MPACELYLAYYATFSTAGSPVNSASKTFKDDLNISPNSNCMGISVKFSKFARGRSKTVMRFGDIIIRVIMWALESSKMSSLKFKNVY